MRGITKFSIAAAIIGIGSLLISYIGGPTTAKVDNGRDCDTVAVMYCGVHTEAEFHQKWNNDKKYKDHATVFAAFGINKNDVKGMVDGVVWRDGRVTLANGTLVATGATTAGRWNNPASDMTRIANTDRAYKMPTRHFVDEGQTAMIKIVDGVFKFAVIKSCGNPVVATPKLQPEASCTSLAQPVITNRTRVALASTANAKNGATIQSHVFTIHDASGKQINQHIITSSANKATTEFIVDKPGNYTAKVVIMTSVGRKESTACVQKFTITPPPATPTAKCTVLDTPVITNRTQVALKAAAEVSGGAKINSYVFTIVDANGKAVTSRTVTQSTSPASATLTVTNPGTYTAKVVVMTSLGEQKGPACEKKFTITPPPAPAAKCDALAQPVITNRTQVALKASASTENGATISAYIFTIVNDKGQVVATEEVKTANKQASAQMNVQAAGTYTAKVVVKTSLGEKKGQECEKKFIIQPEKKPGINIEKKVDGQEHKKVDVDVEYTYQIRVTNTGEVDLKDAVVTDKQPKGVTFLSASHGEIKNGVWTYTIANLKKDESRDFTIKAKVPEHLAGTIINTVCVDTPTIPGSPDDCDDATVEVPPKPEEEVVCRLEDKKYPHTINKDEFDSKLYSRNPEDCKDTPVTPTRLPETGAADGLLNALGLGALTTSAIAYLASRRNSLLG